jgi:cytochrome c oxidase subunit 2
MRLEVVGSAAASVKASGGEPGVTGLNMKAIGGIGRFLVATGAATWAGLGVARANYGFADPGEIGFQKPVTELARYLQWFHDDILLPVILVISLFVLALLGYVVWRFDEKRHPVPSKTTHNTVVEVAWTIIPVIILVFIAIPSFRLLTMQLTIPPADLTIKVTGSQWHWNYAYPKDQGGFAFDSFIKEEKDLKPAEGDIRLLSVDNEAVIPVNKIIRLQVTGADVIHSFIVQSFGVRIDAIPGRLNETWFKADREGIYYGQCSKICGIDHAFMPIAFRVVSEEKYQAWLGEAKKKFASADGRSELAEAGEASPRR